MARIMRACDPQKESAARAMLSTRPPPKRGLLLAGREADTPPSRADGAHRRERCLGRRQTSSVPMAFMQRDRVRGANEANAES